MADDLHARFRLDTATLWEVDDRDSAGDPIFTSSSPRQISVRWENKVATFIGSDGENHNASSFIVTGELLSVGDFLFKGTSAASDPANVVAVFEVMGVNETPSPSGRYVSYMAFLSFRRTL